MSSQTENRKSQLNWGDLKPAFIDKMSIKSGKDKHGKVKDSEVTGIKSRTNDDSKEKDEYEPLLKDRHAYEQYPASMAPTKLCVVPRTQDSSLGDTNPPPGHHYIPAGVPPQFTLDAPFIHPMYQSGFYGNAYYMNPKYGCVPYMYTSKKAFSDEMRRNYAESLAIDDMDPEGYDVVYTDGVCKCNGKPVAIAGIGVWYGDGDSRNLAERCPGKQTNNTAELVAVIRALEETPTSDKPLMVKTDSRYVVDSVQKWIYNWEVNGWKTSKRQEVQNRPLIQYLATLIDYRIKKGQKVVLKHVHGHKGVFGNEMADCLASQGALLPEVEDREWDELRKELFAKMSDGGELNHKK